jgi:hypothetical protein
MEYIYMGVGVMRVIEIPKDKTEGFKLITYTGLYGGRGHLKIETRLRGERFESVMGDCAI